jgi:hypothetical protein
VTSSIWNFFTPRRDLTERLLDDLSHAALHEQRPPKIEQRVAELAPPYLFFVLMSHVVRPLGATTLLLPSISRSRGVCGVASHFRRSVRERLTP